ncbi:hypothetical protein ACSFCW_26285 [Yokenella regensburgei]|uniref:hypothetical protein n=1 Tax=Yokenella regensburgei TaxID=158877 RepID=UPI003ED86A86
MIEAYIDEKETSLLSLMESAFCLASEQIMIIRKMRDITESDRIPEIIRLSARSVGVSLMLSALSDLIDNEEKTEAIGELTEGILTMTKGCILSIRAIRCDFTI